MLVVKQEGSFDNLEKSLKRMSSIDFRRYLSRYGEEGVLALTAATPTDTGITAGSWGYEISHKKGRWTVSWTNSNINKGVPIVLLIQYGHSTGNGGYVRGRDFINPALQPIFDQMANDIWKEVSR